MYRTLHCVALRTIKYSDKNSILTAYSMEMGRVSLFLPAVSGKRTLRYRALTMPMSVFECVADVKNNREIHHFKDLKTDLSHVQIDFDNPMRCSMAFFLSEFFNSTLREPMADEAMYGFLTQTCRVLYSHQATQLANFHIAVMIGALRVFGIEPDTSTASDGSYFDMAEGVWKKDLSGFDRNCLDKEKSRIARLLADINFRNFWLYRLNREQRNEIVDKVMKYLSLHGFGKFELSTIEILKELF